MAVVSEDTLMAIYPAVGEITVSWAIGEQALDDWVLIIYDKAGGCHIEDQIPRSFSRKISFLRKCFKRLPPLQAYAAAASEILDKACAIADDRNYLIHGALRQEAGAGADLRLMFSKIEYEEKTQKLSTRYFTIVQILDVGGKALEFGRRALSMANELADSEWAKTA